MKDRGRAFALFLSLATGCASGIARTSYAQGKEAEAFGETAAEARALDLSVKEFKGDFDGMFDRRVVRILVPHSRTLYFAERGRERGITAQSIREFETYLNKKYKTKLENRPITVFALATTRDKLLPLLAAGKGDIAAGNLTVTDERLKIADFVAPENATSVSELLVTGPASPSIATIDDLAGKKVHVRKSSSYYEGIQLLNDRFQKAGKPLVEVVFVPDALEDEDMMEMLNAGLLEAIVVDDWKARIWATVLPKIKVRNDIVLRTGGKVGWATRKGSPKLAAEIMDFYKNVIQKTGGVEARLANYQRRVKQIQNPTKSQEWKRFEDTVALFRKYGGRYHFDPLMLAAQGYQESALNQEARSQVGAIGIMQVMPATGAELKVGDITIAEPNVHAGSKYMDNLMERFFKDAKFDDQNRTLFAFASYNCGPGNVSRMRKLAEKRGFDPDVWFNNVEIVTAEKIGTETTTYVRNIFKYYAAYKLSLEAEEEQGKARGQLKSESK